MLEFYNKGFYKDAEKLALSIIQTSPKDALSWKNLGDIYFRTERLHEAFNAFRKSMKLIFRDSIIIYTNNFNIKKLK